MPRVTESSDSRIPPGSELLAVNGHPIDDLLDLSFYNDVGDRRKVLIAANGWKKRIIFKPGEKIRVKIAEPAYRSCENACRFCFVNGLPPGLRREVYFRDDDYRLSFLFGNFLSLTNLYPEDVERIGRLRLSPLYVSVHSTIPKIRKKLFGNPRAGLVIRQIRELAEKKIALHCQVVVIPGMTDGRSLEQTISELAGSYPAVSSIGVVPVGKSKYIKGISKLTKAKARETIRTVERFRQGSYRRTGRGIVYAADELFVRAGLPMPPRTYYDDLPQHENGIGMVREFVDEIASLKSASRVRGRFLFVTGEMAFPFVSLLQQRLRAGGWHVDLVKVENALFGRTVTVSGLLGAGDISKKVNSIKRKYDRVILPPNCVNDEGKFIDDRELRIKNFLVAPYSVKELIKCLR